MSHVKRLLREEAEHAEQNKDAEPSESTTMSRPGRDRAKVLSVRFNADEYEKLAARAEVAGIGPSTLARSLVLQAMDPAEGQALSGPWMEGVSKRLTRLEEQAATEG